MFPADHPAAGTRDRRFSSQKVLAAASLKPDRNRYAAGSIQIGARIRENFFKNALAIVARRWIVAPSNAGGAQ